MFSKRSGEFEEMKINQIRFQLIDVLKTNKVLRPLYTKMKGLENAKRFSLHSTRGYAFSADDNTKLRISLVLPTLRKTKVFGGINTALKFFTTLVDFCDADGRILVLNDENAGSKWEYPVKSYSSTNAKRNISYLPQLDSISIRRGEILIFTSWKTAYMFGPLFKWKKDNFCDYSCKAVYLIQDFEPGFYPWSTEYALAELTYNQNKESIIAVINSRQLYDFMKIKGYSFFKMMYFDPVLNDKLKEKVHLYKDGKKRKKQILIYGRPSEDRNAFEIIRYSLQEWSKIYSGAKEWDIVSLGEYYGSVKLENNTIEAKGKVSLDEYARIMGESYAGISLMVSPHPSYPPLEMSTFGVRTITNCYENKDLSDFNSNIISLKTCDPEKIVETLITLCDEYDNYVSNIDVNDSYYSNDTMSKCILEIKEHIDKSKNYDS